MNIENQGATGDRFQIDPHPEVYASVYRSAQPMDSDPEEISYTNCNVHGVFTLIDFFKVDGYWFSYLIQFLSADH